MSKEQKNTELLQIDVFEVLRRRFPLILLGCVLGVAVAALYCFTAKLRYESHGVVMVMPKDSRITSNRGPGGTDLGMQANVGEELLATHIQILTSPKVIKAALMDDGNSEESMVNGNIVIDPVEDATEPDAQPGQPLIALTSLANELPDTKDHDSPLYRKNAVAYIKENLSVSRGGEGASKDAQVLRVRLEHTEPDDCQAILGSIIKSYQSFLRATADDAGEDARQLFQQASLDLEKKLKEQDESYRKFLDESPVMWGASGAAANPLQTQVAGIETELAELRLRRTELRARIQLTEASLKEGNEDSLQRLTVFDPADVSRLAFFIQLDSESFDRTQPERSQLAGVKIDELLALQKQDALDAVKVGANHPRRKQLREGMDSVRQFLQNQSLVTGENSETPVVNLDRLVSLYHRLLKHDLSHVESREKELTALLEEENIRAKKMVENEFEAERLRRDFDRTQSLYDTVVDRLREVNLAKVYGAFTTELISPPEAGTKSWPKIPLLLALGSMLGTLAGAALAVAAELSDRSFRGHEDIEQEIGTTVLTHIPVMEPRDLRQVKKGSNLAPQLVAFHQPKSHHAEAIRNLRASVYFRTNGLDSPVIQITSPNPGDGKSTMAANLAVSIAQTNKRVLLLECDMRRPSQHKIFGFNRDERGLSDILVRDCSIDEATIPCEGVPNLYMISSGGVPDNPAELLALPDFNQFLAVVRDDYDFVIIDSPPIAPVSDSAVIASLADRVILALTLSKNARSAASDAHQTLVSHGADVMGLVVSKYGGSNSYGYSYGYAYGGGKYEKAGYYTYS